MAVVHPILLCLLFLDIIRVFAAICDSLSRPRIDTTSKMGYWVELEAILPREDTNRANNEEGLKEYLEIQILDYRMSMLEESRTT